MLSARPLLLIRSPGRAGDSQGKAAKKRGLQSELLTALWWWEPQDNCVLCVPSECLVFTLWNPGGFWLFLFCFAFYLIEGRLEVFQGEKLLSSIPMWTTFGELAILYNCTRTASVKGDSNGMVYFHLLRSVKEKLSCYSILSLFVSHHVPNALINRNATLIKRFILRLLFKWFGFKNPFHQIPVDKIWIWL